MASLFGAITSDKKEITAEQIIKRNQIVRGLAVYSENKGTDATGIGLSNKNRYGYLKQAVGATQFLQTPKYKEFMLDYSPLIILGHTKTFFYDDDKTGDSAHPFIKGNIMGSHVGTVTGFEKIDPTAKIDSEAIFALLNKNKNDFVKTFAELEGTFALTWINGALPDRVFIGKKDMPLFIAFSPQLKTYFWSSLEEPFASLFEVVGVKDFFTWEVKRNTVYEITTSLKTKRIDVSFKSKVTEVAKPNYEFTETWYDRKEREEREAIEKIIYPQTFLKSLSKIQEEFKKGCVMCQQKIDLTALGFYWHKNDEFICCSDCTNLFKEEDWKLFEYITVASLLHKTTALTVI